jgi:hypothetical protein
MLHADHLQAPLEPPSRAAFDVFQADLVKLAAGILRTTRTSTSRTRR